MDSKSDKETRGATCVIGSLKRKNYSREKISQSGEGKRQTWTASTVSGNTQDFFIMPFKSEKQKKFLFANKPEIAKRWAKNYNKGGPVIITPRGFGRMLPSKRPRTKLYV